MVALECVSRVTWPALKGIGTQETDGRTDEWYLYLGGGGRGGNSSVFVGGGASWSDFRFLARDAPRWGGDGCGGQSRADHGHAFEFSRSNCDWRKTSRCADVDGQWEGLFLHGEEASRVTTAAARARRPWAMSEPGNGGTSKSSLPDRSYRGREVRASRVSVPRYGIRTSGRRNCRYPPRSVRDGSRW